VNTFNLGMEVLFWLSLGLVAYTYFVYPVALFVGYSPAQLRSDWRYLVHRRSRRAPALQEDALPEISFLTPAYDEEAHLLDKIINLREMDYPRQKVQVLFVSGGSTDQTNEIPRHVADTNIEAIVLPHRSGKVTALNQAGLRAHDEILAFSDASTLFAPDALRELL
jgi:cellulose synthase/poly-beta-1,6-N-acetylglucosamine synthase-like glycosyltransferase